MRSSLTRSSLVALFVLGGCVGGCSEDSSGTGDPILEDSGFVDETSTDTSMPDTEAPDTEMPDTTTPETAAETSDDTSIDAAETSVDAGDDTVAADAADTAVATDAGDAMDDAMGDAMMDGEAPPACTSGTLCPDNTICTAGVCTPCTADSECSTIDSTRLCYAGACLPGTCKPKPATTSGCTAMGSICCATMSTAGTCIAPVSGKTMCCDNTDCASDPAGLTKCDTTTNTCGCPDPTPGTWYVGPTGNDTTGNGSAACPFKTITNAVTKSVGAVGATTIILQKASTGVTTYGSGCTGGGTCDTTPILVPSTITTGLTIKGAGAPADVVVTGAGNSVFGVSTAGVSFDSMTIRPTKVGAGNTGGHGIVFDYAMGTEGTGVTNVVITGVASLASPSGSGIILKGGAAPKIGPGVTITGGFHGLLVQGTALANLIGDATKQTSISGASGACIYVDGTATGANPVLNAASSGTGKDVLIRDCGVAGGVVIDHAAAGTTSSITGAAFTRTGTPYMGVSLLRHAKLSLTNTSFTGLGAVGITAANNSSLTVSTGTTITGAAGRGIYATNFANVTLDGVSVTGTTVSGTLGGDGVRCDSSTTLKIANSTTLSNAGNGVVVVGGCNPDFSGGNNVFNKTTVTLRNALAGVCLKTSAVATVSIPNSTFSCNFTGTGCDTTGGLSPTEGTPLGVAECRAGVDVSEDGVAAAEPGAKCCNN